ncbi:MAG: RelA/SpoT domain-containing protein [Bdellovibrionales bacterium]
MISNRKIDLIGQKIKASEVLTKRETEDFLAWRKSFESSLDYFFKRLKAYSLEEDLVSIAKRIKRTESIQIKLKRFKSLRLSTLQDVAGARVVLKNTEALNQVFSKIRGASSKSKLKKLDDYVGWPKSDGYRGVHLIYQHSDSKVVELQLRTQLQHIWATSVEIYGFLQNVSFKTGSGEKDWQEFFKFLSSYFAILENGKVIQEHELFSDIQLKSKLKRITKKLKAIEILNSATLGIEVVINKKNKARNGKLALLELDYSSLETRIDIYTKSQFDLAVEDYTKREIELKGSHSNNVVLVNIENVDALKASYPNYFLDTRELLQILSKLILEK